MSERLKRNGEAAERLTSLFAPDPAGTSRIKGSVQAQWVRCGKAGCRCAGGRLHGPYYYLFLQDGPRQRKVYLRPGDVAAVRAGCDRYREDRRREREELRRAWAWLRGIDREMREIMVER